MAYRNQVHSSTNESPFFFMYGRDLELPFHSDIRPERVRYDLQDSYASELRARLQQAHEIAKQNLDNTVTKRCERFNKRARNRDFCAGDRVFLHTPAIRGRNLATKFYPKWSGLFLILERT